MQVHHLFFSSDASVSTLFQRITPTPEQREQQRERWQDLRDYLVVDLEERSGRAMSSWLQGSYKLGTQTRPAKMGQEFDIDLGIYFNWPGAPADGGVSPAMLKHYVQQSLLAYAAEAKDDVLEVLTPPKERCSRIRFSGDFHIDVPCYHLDAGRDLRHLATETKGWEHSDPKAFVVWFRNLFADDDHAQVRRLIRYLKVWSCLNLAHGPSSMLLTVLAAEAFQSLPDEQRDGDDVALKHVAEGILRRLQGKNEPVVSNPARGQTHENLNRLTPDQLATFLDGLAQLITIADAALSAPTEAGAALQWVSAFQHFFPAAREQVATSGSTAVIPMAFDPQIGVIARPRAGGPSFRNTNRIGPIPKDCDLSFTLENAVALPTGARVRWIVRNEGAEAEAVNDMGHIGVEGLNAEEHSSYRGTHSMDVVVTSALGNVIGFRRVPVQITGTPMTKRNPQRPGWTRFRQQRR